MMGIQYSRKHPTSGDDKTLVKSIDKCDAQDSRYIWTHRYKQIFVGEGILELSLLLAVKLATPIADAATYHKGGSIKVPPQLHEELRTYLDIIRDDRPIYSVTSGRKRQGDFSGRVVEIVPNA